LEKVEARHGELLEGAAEDFPALVSAADFDTLPFSNAMMALRTQCIELRQKIDRSWHESAEPALGEAWAVIREERERGAACGWRMERALCTAEVQLPAAAAELVMARARQALVATFKCKRCGAPMSPRQDFFRSHYVDCQFCQSVNTFEPGTLVRQVEHFCVRALAERAALDAHLAFLDAEHAFRKLRSEERDPHRLPLLEKHARYVDALLTERVRLLPELAKDLEADRRSRLESFRRSVE
jgi:hypothetical protein